MIDIETTKAIAQQFLKLVSEHEITELCEMVPPS